MPLIDISRPGRCFHFTWPKYLSAEGGADPMQGSGSGNATTMLTYLHNREAGINAANGTAGWRFAGPRVYFQSLADANTNTQTWCKRLETAGYVTALGWALNHDPAGFTAAQWTTLGNWMHGIPGSKVFLPFGEFDRQLPGGTTAAQWIAGWRLMYNTISAIDPNVIFGYCTTAEQSRLNPGPISTYYPGDAYVDIVCPQGYNGPGGQGKRHPVTVYAEWHGAFNVTNGTVGRRPLGITEWATLEASTSTTACLNFPGAVPKPTWNREFGAYINANDVRIEAIFETDKCRDGTGGIVMDGRADSIVNSNNHSMTGASFVAYAAMIAATDTVVIGGDTAPSAAQGVPTLSTNLPVVGQAVTLNPDSTLTSWGASPAPTYTQVWQLSTDGGATWTNAGTSTTTTIADTYARTVAAGGWGTLSTPAGATGWIVRSGTASNFSVANPWGLIQLPAPGGAAQTSTDTFTRGAVVAGWGALTTPGGATGWTLANGTAAFFATNGTQGTLQLPGPSGTTVTDTFTRTTASGWGNTTPAGGTWTLAFGTAAAFSTNGSTARVVLPAATAVQQVQVLNVSVADSDTTVDWSFSADAAGPNAGDGHYATILARYTGAGNWYQARFQQFASGGHPNVVLRKSVGGSNLPVATALTAIAALQAGATYHLRFRVVGQTLQAKIWAGAAEPATWDITATDPDLAAAGNVGLGASKISNTTTGTPTHSFDTFATTAGAGGSASAVQQVMRAGIPALADVNVLADWTTTQAAAGSSAGDGQFPCLFARFTDMNNHYQARFVQAADAAGSVSVILRNGTAGAAGLITQAAATNVTQILSNTTYRLRFQVQGTQLQAKIWPAANAEPATWDVDMPYTSTIVSGDAAVGGALSTNTTDSNPLFRFDNFSATAVGAGGATPTTRQVAGVGGSYADINIAADFQFAAAAAGPNATDGHYAGLVARANAGADTCYIGRLVAFADGTTQAQIQKIVGGVGTQIASGPAGVAAVTVNTTYRMRLTATGQTLQFRAWQGVEPAVAWDVTATDAAITAAGDAGLVAAQASSSTTSSSLVRFGSMQAATQSTPVAATGATYTPLIGDLNKLLRANVTATNTAGSATKATAATGAVTAAGSIPTAGTESLSDSTPQVSEVINAINGSDWGGVPFPVFTYQWQTSADAVTWTNATGVGATAQGYTVASADLNRWLRVRVTGSNPLGNAQAFATSTAVVTAASLAPINTVPPLVVVVAPTLVGQAIATGNGSWLNTPTSFLYSWQRQVPGQATWQIIAGATASTYTPVSGDVGFVIQSRVVAVNAAGQSNPTAASNQTGVVTAASAPTGGVPTINDTTPTVGQVVTCDANGGAPWVSPGVITFTYQWQTGSNGVDWFNAAGVPNACAASLATTCTYTVNSADRGQFLRCQVTAQNTTGSTVAAAAPTAAVAAAATTPAPLTVPLLTPPPGAALAPGTTLQTSDGTWTNTPTSFAYQWQRRLGTAGAFTTISGATNNTYTILSTDVGYQLEAVVTATNTAGSRSTASQASTLVALQLIYTVRCLSPQNGQHVTTDPVPFTVTAQAQDGSGSRPSSVVVVADGVGSGVDLPFSSSSGQVHTYAGQVFIVGAGADEAHNAHVVANA